MKPLDTMQPVDWDQIIRSSDELFSSDDWLAQEKVDGVKIRIVSNRGNLTAFYRSGRAAEITAETRAFMPSTGTFVIEGEQGNRLTGSKGFVAFDVLSIGDDDVRKHSYDVRVELLSSVGVPMVSSAYGKPAKTRLFERVREKGGEGLVFKHRMAKYYPGPTQFQMKMRNWKSDTFRVVAADSSGMEIQTLTGVPAGRSPGFAKPGQLVEIKFQEVTSTGKLRVPVFLGVREDL